MPKTAFIVKKRDFLEISIACKKKISEYSELDKTKTYKAWAEVKIKTEVSNDNDEMKTFDYTFDYVLSAVDRKKVSDISSLLSLSPDIIKKTAEKNGYTIASRDAEYWIDDFPADPLIIIEVMTSSTSCGDKKKRTQIAMACEDAILNGMKHNAPGINYRQVWARMVSQLIVKSQVALAWNGSAIWLVQDVLADYISKSTALVLSEYLAERLDEVNILAVSYGEKIKNKIGEPIELSETELFSGAISGSAAGDKIKGFIDIIKIGAPPPKTQIWKSLLNKQPLGMWRLE